MGNVDVTSAKVVLPPLPPLTPFAPLDAPPVPAVPPAPIVILYCEPGITGQNTVLCIEPPPPPPAP